jgi:hypothetical protein
MYLPSRGSNVPASLCVFLSMAGGVEWRTVDEGRKIFIVLGEC